MLNKLFVNVNPLNCDKLVYPVGKSSTSVSKVAPVGCMESWLTMHLVISGGSLSMIVQL